MKADRMPNRRQFLLVSTLGMAAAAVTARSVTGGGISSVTPPKSEGYRVSLHILKYYDTAKV